MKKIIIPVDFTDYSENAIKNAAYFAKKIKAEIILVHMILSSEALITSSKNTNIENKIYNFQITKKHFANLLAKDFLSEQKVSIVVEKHKSFKDLGKTAEEKGADLILMASQGTKGFKELFKGSNTEKVVRNSKTPALVIKDKPITEANEKAIFACDFSKEFIRSYQKTKDLLDVLECDMQLLHINTPDEKFKTSLDRKGKVINFLIEAEGDLENFEKVVFTSDYNIEDGILSYANEAHKDLIIMPTHGKKGLEGLFSGSIAKDIVNHTSMPVLTIAI